MYLLWVNAPRLLIELANLIYEHSDNEVVYLSAHTLKHNPFNGQTRPLLCLCSGHVV